MAAKHKERILEILKQSGPLQASVLKERILSDLYISEEDYPKSTYQRHLSELCYEAKITYKEEDNKRTYFVENFSHPVQGGLLIEKLGGRITAPGPLCAFTPQLDNAHKEQRDPEKFHLIFEFNSIHLCFSIYKEALPFNLHISRFKDEKISEKVLKAFGSRTIVLELPVKTLSSFKDEEGSGHAVLQFQSSTEVTVKELNATNPVEWLSMKDMDLAKYSKGIYLSSTATVRNEVDDRFKNILSRTKFKKNESKNLKIPIVLQMSSDSFVSIF
jgi:hypothetical protein